MKNKGLEITAWIMIVTGVLAVASTGEIISYLYLFLLAGYALLYSRGKVKNNTILWVGSIFCLVVRTLNFSEAYDLVDIGIWASMIYFLASKK